MLVSRNDEIWTQSFRNGWRSSSQFKKGKLKSGKGGKATSRKQAIAIGLSEAREKGGKVPKKD